MFERFTDRARRVVVLAQEEARMLNHNYIGTGHLLLGLIRGGEGVAASALEELGIELGAARRHVDGLSGRGQSAPGGHIPFTERAKKILELSLSEAFRLGNDRIGTEHILLELVHEKEGVAAQVLQRFGDAHQDVGQEVLRLLRGYRGAVSQELQMSEQESDLMWSLGQESAELDELWKRFKKTGSRDTRERLIRA